MAEVLGTEWERFTDPTTTTEELLMALGLDPVGAPDGQTPNGEPC